MEFVFQTKATLTARLTNFLKTFRTILINTLDSTDA